jgi:hypothetical protein
MVERPLLLFPGKAEASRTKKPPYHPIDEWRRFDDDVISEMGSRALEWWKKYKNIILQIIELSPATPTGHEGSTQ